MAKMIEKEYMVYNQDEIRSIGCGMRKIFVRESKKYAYIRDNFERRIRMKLKMWLHLKENVYKLKEGI
jgi:hypothetical protein